jgi:hypothetical protein
VGFFSVSSVCCPICRALSKNYFCGSSKKRDEVVFRRASSSRLVIRSERVNSLHLARRSAPLHVKRFQKSVSAVLHLALRNIDRHGEQKDAL